MSADQRISELEHDTGQVLPCSWDDCPSCRRIMVTRIRLNGDAVSRALAAAGTQRLDDPPLDLTGPEFYTYETKEWWR